MFFLGITTSDSKYEKQLCVLLTWDMIFKGFSVFYLWWSQLISNLHKNNRGLLNTKCFKPQVWQETVDKNWITKNNNQDKLLNVIQALAIKIGTRARYTTPLTSQLIVGCVVLCFSPIKLQTSPRLCTVIKLKKKKKFCTRSMFWKDTCCSLHFILRMVQTFILPFWWLLPDTIWS